MDVGCSIVGGKTMHIFKLNPVCNAYYVVSEIDDVVKSGYFSCFGIINIEWFVSEVIQIEKKMKFYFEKTKKDIIMTPEDEKDFMKSTVCWFCEQPVSLEDKVRDHCHLTDKYRAAHYTCNVKVKRNKSKFIHSMFHNFSNYDCHLFFKTLVDRKPSQVPLQIIPKTNEEDISVTTGCIVFIDSHRILGGSIDLLVISVDDLPFPKKEFPERWGLLNKKLAYPH